MGVQTPALVPVAQKAPHGSSKQPESFRENTQKNRAASVCPAENHFPRSGVLQEASPTLGAWCSQVTPTRNPPKVPFPGPAHPKALGFGDPSHPKQATRYFSFPLCCFLGSSGCVCPPGRVASVFCWVNLALCRLRGWAPRLPRSTRSPSPLGCQLPFVPVIFKAFSDDDLASIVDGGYSPDKKKGKRWPTYVRLL